MFFEDTNLDLPTLAGSGTPKCLGVVIFETILKKIWGISVKISYGHVRWLQNCPNAGLTPLWNRNLSLIWDLVAASPVVGHFLLWHEQTLSPERQRKGPLCWNVTEYRRTYLDMSAPFQFCLWLENIMIPIGSMEAIYAWHHTHKSLSHNGDHVQVI